MNTLKVDGVKRVSFEIYFIIFTQDGKKEFKKLTSISYYFSTAKMKPLCLRFCFVRDIDNISQCQRSSSCDLEIICDLTDLWNSSRISLVAGCPGFDCCCLGTDQFVLVEGVSF